MLVRLCCLPFGSLFNFKNSHWYTRKNMVDLKNFSCFIISLCFLIVALPVTLKVAKRRREQSLKLGFYAIWKHNRRTVSSFLARKSFLTNMACLQSLDKWGHLSVVAGIAWIYPMHTDQDRLYGSQAQRNRNVQGVNLVKPIQIPFSAGKGENGEV